MDSVLFTLLIVGFLGGAGLVAGYAAGRVAIASRGGLLLAGLIGGSLGLLCGIAFAVEIVREVFDSTSSTASIGLLIIPIPLIANALTGTLVSLGTVAWTRR